MLNNKVFRRIGLNLPNHVMTQLSISKTGIAQSFLYNLRAWYYKKTFKLNKKKNY